MVSFLMIGSLILGLVSMKRKVTLLIILMFVIGIAIPSSAKAEGDIRIRIEYIDMDDLHQIVPATNTRVKSGEATILYPPEIDGYYIVTKGVEVTFTST